MRLSCARHIWGMLLAATGALLATALLPSVLPADLQPVVRRCFASVCHQLPSRSLHVGGVALAVCDRCIGIYAGLVAGVAVTGGRQKAWERLGRKGKYVLLGSLVPLGINWIGPVIGLWGNGPIDRGITGAVFGVVAASYVTDRLLRRATRTPSGEGPRQA